MISSRRQFIRGALGASVAAALAPHAFAADAPVTTTTTAAATTATTAPKLKKAVKYGMIRGGNSVKEKLDLVKSLGFQGVELDSPSDINKDEAVKAQAETGVKIHGVIDSVHWKERLSDPDPAVRAKGLAALTGAIADAKLFGADTVLLVPGKVSNPETENFEQVWQRSQEEVRKAIPAAQQAGVKIAIEVVWNDFLTKPEQLVKYVDEFKSPSVGAYFDVSNMIKYGVAPADWIRALGPRMLKFDFKGYSKEKGWVAIGDGDENWPEVLKALSEVGYNGWATSEVAGGGEKELREIAERMNRVLGLA
ncbi:MAG: L-ribulose-5-phosphate 3-epimerase [Phycisphaerales bacterium]|nr:L-ribulose-5-phosphate 3-epimerase [Phycisphaerales bacterium]